MNEFDAGSLSGAIFGLMFGFMIGMFACSDMYDAEPGYLDHSTQEHRLLSHDWNEFIDITRTYE